MTAPAPTIAARRPPPLGLPASRRAQLALMASLGVFAWAVNSAAPAGLTAAGWHALCVFALAATLWATALLPPAVTSLLAMGLAALLEVRSPDAIYGSFGSRAVFFLLGALILSAAMVASGLSKRLATTVVHRLGRTPRRLVLSVFGLSALGSTVMSAHAVAAMMLPLVLSTADVLKLAPGRSRLGRTLCFAMAWGCVIGGSLTVLGGARAPLALGILEEAAGGAVSLGFSEFIVYVAPAIVVLAGVAALLLVRGLTSEVARVDAAAALLGAELMAMGPVSPRELVVGAVAAAAVVAWVTVGDAVGLEVVALGAVAALFALGAVSWADVEARVSWGVVIMYGGAIALSAAMADSGAAQWLAAALLGDLHPSPFVLIAALALVTAVLTELMSGAAVVALLMPPALSLAETHGLDVRVVTMAVVLPSSFAFTLPIGTPATAMAWGTGYYTPGPVLRHGAVLHATGLAATLGLAAVWWPLVGLL